MASADPELLEAILAACESGDMGPYYQVLERRDERYRLFMILRLLSDEPDRREKAGEVISGFGWAGFLPDGQRERFIDELVELVERVEAGDDILKPASGEEQQQFAIESERLLSRWHRIAERSMTPQEIARFREKPGHRPGSSWRFRVERPPLIHTAIVDSSENHLTTVFSRLVVDAWFDLERTDEDRWRIRVGDLNVLVTVDRAGQATSILADTPPEPPGVPAGKAPAFRVAYARLDGRDAAHIRMLDPHPDLVPVLPTAQLWQAGGPWSILCGLGEEAQLEEVHDPPRVCKICKKELRRIEELVDGARWEVARQLAGPELEDVVRAKLAEVPF